MQTAHCPSPDTLKQLLLGTLSRNERELLEEHLLSCDRCVSKAETIVADDDLTAMTRTASPLPAEDADAIAALIEKIKQARFHAETLRVGETMPGNLESGSGASPQSYNLSFLAPAQSADELGRLGDYRVLEVLGAGGMGLVLRAEDTKLRRHVALKTMKPSIAESPAAKVRFTREAQATAALEHDHIVPIYQVGEDRGVPFIAMQYLKGESLKSRLDRKPRLSGAEVVRIGKEVASGLALAHEHRMIHRDIKPDNIWLEEKTDRAKILDFGLVSASLEDEGLTHSGTVLGTPRYMSPEQALAHPIDHRCDLFSLGSVLYHAAAGQPPFSGNNFTSTLIAVAHQPPLPLQQAAPELHPEVAAAIMGLLEKDPDKRPQTASEVTQQFADLEQILKRVRIQESTDDHLSDKVSYTHLAPSPVLPPSKPPRRRLLLAGAGGLATLLFGILVITIRDKDGKETTVRVPSGIEVDVDAQPGSKVTIREEESSAPQAMATPVAASSSDGWHGWPADAPKPAIAPFDAAQAKKHQEEWATYLKVPVEYTNSIGMKFQLIPPGEFMMGSTAEEIEEILSIFVFEKDERWLECIKSGTPQHNVILTQPIYMGANEVTQKEYESLMRATPSYFSSTGPGKEAISNVDTQNHPVESVSWNDAAEFSAKLSQQEKLKPFYFLADETITPLDGTGYRLPTEAEWEFACRAGTTTTYWSGDKDDQLLRAGWFGENSGRRTHAGGELNSNPFGLYDLHGNVFEWVNDAWDPLGYSQFLKQSAINPMATPSANSWHVLRGGDWFHIAAACRFSCRRAKAPTSKDSDLGFRMSLTIDAVRQALNQPMATNPQSTKHEIPTLEPVDTVGFALERKIAPRLQRLGKGRVVLGNKERRPVADWNLANLPSEPFCILEADLAGTELTDGEIVALKGCQALLRLDVSSNPALSDAGFERLGVLPMLTSLNVSQSGLGNKFISWLANSPDLETIDLSGTKLEAGAMEALPELKSLHSLRLPNTISISDLKRLGERAPFLRELDVVVDDPAAIVSLAGRPHLVKLGLAGAAVTAETIKSLQSMPHLESLVIHQPTSEAVTLLPQLNPKLVSLELVQNGDVSELSSSDLKPLARMKQLAHLSLRGTLPIDRSLLNEIATIKWLRSLTIDDASDDDRQAFRQQRPDLDFIIGETHYPALDDWPGKFEGSRSIVAWDLPPDAPKPAVVPFTPEEAAQHQTAWAEYLNIPDESENSIGMKFRLIPPGELTSDALQTNSYPSCAVLDRFPEGLEIGATEVTFAQFEVFIKETGYRTDAELFGSGYSQTGDGVWAARPEVTWRTPGYETRPDLPVTVVSASDVSAFCNWLSRKEGLLYRLPTRNEWEFAGRGGGAMRLGWCTELDVAEYDWFQDNLPDQWLGPQPVATKKANPFGLHGVLGNVYELASLPTNQIIRLGVKWAHPANDSPWMPIVIGDGSATDMGFRVVRTQPVLGTKAIKIAQNAPLSSTTTVPRPTPIPGIRSWSVERVSHNTYVNQTRWSPRGDVIATCANDLSVRLWNRDGTIRTLLKGHSGPVSSLSFSSDGKYLATINFLEPYELRVWEVDSGKCVRQAAHRFWVPELAFSPVGNRIAVTGGMVIDSVPVLDVFDLETIASTSLPVAGPFTWSHDGESIIGFNGGDLVEIRVSDGEILRQFDLDLTEDEIKQDKRIAVSPDGSTLAIVNPSALRLLDLQKSAPASKFSLGYQFVREVQWAPTGQQLLIVCQNDKAENIQVFDVPTGAISMRLNGYNDESSAWSPDGTEIAFYNRDSSALTFVNSTTGELVRKGASNLGHLYRPQSQLLSADDELVVGSEEFSVAKGDLLRTQMAVPGGLKLVAPQDQWRAYDNTGSGVLIVPRDLDRDTVKLSVQTTKEFWRTNPTGELIAQVNAQVIEIWNTETGQKEDSLVHPANVWSFEWSTDGKRIASIADDERVRIWDSTSRQLVGEFSDLPSKLEPYYEVRNGTPVIQWSADNRYLWIPQGSGWARLDTHTGLVDRRGAVGLNSCASLALAPNQQRFLFREGDCWTTLVSADGSQTRLGVSLGISAQWHDDSRRFLGSDVNGLIAYDAVSKRRLGTLWADLPDGHWMCVGPTGHCRGSKGVAEHVVYVAQLDDGSNVTLSPQEFAKRFGWKNDPDKATLMEFDE